MTGKHDICSRVRKSMAIANKGRFLNSLLDGSEIIAEPEMAICENMHHC